MRRKWLLTSLGLSVLAGSPAMAQVTKFEILSRGPAFEGRSFGASGPVEMIVARATIAVDPKNPRNAQIVDLDRAPRNADGRVEASTDVVILRPSAASGPMLVEMPNRGGALLNRWVHDAPADGGPPAPGAAPQARSPGSAFAKASDGGNGFLFEQGVTVVEVGWQGDVDSGIGARPPVIKGLTGPSRETWTWNGAETVQRVTLSYPAAAGAAGLLTARATPDAEAKPVAGLTYRQIDPMTIEVTRPAGMGARTVYEFNYTATDPAVMGMGFAALRDVVSFLKHDKTAANPLAAPQAPARAIGFGVSQSGRALRDFLYLGFNADDRGRMVFDGMLPVIPGARRSFTNVRFGQPGRNPGPQADRLYPVAQFPFAYETSLDPVTGASDGVLKQCRLTRTCPKIVEIDSEYEFWGSAAGLNVTDVTGKPLALPPEVRAFMIAGAPHSSSGGRVSQPSATCKLASSPVQGPPLIRALFVSLNQWLGGTAPPASRYPMLSDGTLGPAATAYPAGGALPYQGQYGKVFRFDQTAAGPVVKGEYALLVPQAGPDGNARGGVKMPMVAAPRASYTGWNPLKGADGSEDLCTQAGGALPFAATRAERAANDTRPTLEDLYPTDADYVAKVKAAADELVAARLLLPADAAADVKLAEAGRLARLAPAGATAPAGGAGGGR